MQRGGQVLSFAYLQDNLPPCPDTYALRLCVLDSLARSSLKAIGDHFGLHYSRVSRILKKLRIAKGKT